MKTEIPRKKVGKYLILPEEFSQNGFEFKEIERKKDIAIFAQHKSNGLVGYEVIKINKHEGYEIAGNKIEPAEIYPSAQQWGTFGWTYSTLKEAKEKFNKLIKKQIN